MARTEGDGGGDRGMRLRRKTEARSCRTDQAVYGNSNKSNGKPVKELYAERSLRLLTVSLISV